MDHSDTLPPDGIPQDVWEAAEDAFDTVLCNDIQASGSSTQFRIDSITPVARAIMAERERCAGIIDAANAHYAEQHELAKNTRPNREVRDLQTMRIATAGLSALIRGGQS